LAIALSWCFDGSADASDAKAAARTTRTNAPIKVLRVVIDRIPGVEPRLMKVEMIQPVA
jgi:hypothetical protein